MNPIDRTAGSDMESYLTYGEAVVFLWWLGFLLFLRFSAWHFFMG
jgi:hypothetical protein